MRVYVLWHTHDMGDDDEDAKLLGIYSSKERAEEHLQQARTLPGFRRYPDGFTVDEYEVDESAWTDGFASFRSGKWLADPEPGERKVELYEAIDVWRRTTAGLKRYRCFRIVETGRFVVQSVDVYYGEPRDSRETRFANHDLQFVELLSEVSPEERSRAYVSLEDAIAAFDADFE
jgi:hypothetical protein